MNHVAKFLAQGLNTHVNKRIVSIEYKRGSWLLIDPQGNQHSGFDWIICTVPPPQSAKLLPQSFKYYADIHATKMRTCVSLMLGFEQKLNLEFDAAHVTNLDVGWIAVNNSKLKRSGLFTLMVHSSEEYAKNILITTVFRLRSI